MGNLTQLWVANHHPNNQFNWDFPQEEPSLLQQVHPRIVMLKPQEVLDRYYLETRCMLLETAAVLDRYDAAVEREGSAAEDELKLDVLHKALQVLAEPNSSEKAEELLNLFVEVPT